MKSEDANDGKNYAQILRARANRLRATADNMQNEQIRSTLLHIAETYEKLADQMEGPPR
jgi:hypothetical protein